MSRRTWARRYAFEIAALGTVLLFLAKDCVSEDPVCSSDKCPGDSIGIHLEGDCWCITKPEP